MKTETKAGGFNITSYTDGYPHWVEITREGKELVRMHHSELKDLEYAVSRHRELLGVNAKNTDQREI